MLVRVRSDRLLRLLFVLQRRQAATASALADELEVSLRTLYRDVAGLMAAGVPLYTERGPGGGIRLLPGWRTKLDGLTGDEAGALALAGAPQALRDLGLASVALSARAKLDATLPAELRGRAQRIHERFLLDAPGWFERAEVPSELPRVAEAVWSERRLALVYAGKQRRVDPLGMVLKAGVWYLVARHRGQQKTFRVSKIARARVLAQRFERPADFELSQHWSDATRRFDAEILRYPCRVRLTRRGMALLPLFAPNLAIRQQLTAAGEPDTEGFYTLVLRLESEHVALSQLLGLGDQVEVLEPASLRAGMHVLAGRVAARHALTPQPARAPTSTRDPTLAPRSTNRRADTTRRRSHR